MAYERNDTSEIDGIIQHIRNNANFSAIGVELFAPDGEWGTQIARFLREKTKMTQLRKVFGEIKRIERKTKGKGEDAPFEDQSSLYLLIPQLAFAKARKLIQDKFYEIIKLIIGGGKNTPTKIKTIGDYQRFVEFMTAIVAYHKEYSK